MKVMTLWYYSILSIMRDDTNVMAIYEEAEINRETINGID